MKFKNSFLNSLSPFWMTIKADGQVVSCSDYFSKHIEVEKPFQNFFTIKKLYIKDKTDYFKSLKGKVLKLTLDSNKVLFRGCLHIEDQLAIMVLWPLLNNLNLVRELNLEEEMSHPAAMITDILISKNVIYQNTQKVKKLEMEAMEQEYLQKNLEFLESIENNAHQAMITTDNSGSITSFNEAAEKILGYHKSDLINKETPLIFHDPNEVESLRIEFSESHKKDIKPGLETLTCCTEDGKTSQFECTYIKKSGDRLPVLLSVTALTKKRQRGSWPP
ncbi:MAG: PAS domain S-box protein, partial [Bdellovibrionales bacterium]|nr:PAS domain S-box protein [Bdellovibrionales bacterium]